MSVWARNAVAKGTFDDKRDAELAQACARGNARLFNELVRIYHRDNRYLRPDLPKLATPYPEVRANRRRSHAPNVVQTSERARRFGLRTSAMIDSQRLTARLTPASDTTPGQSGNANSGRGVAPDYGSGQTTVQQHRQRGTRARPAHQAQVSTPYSDETTARLAALGIPTDIV